MSSSSHFMDKQITGLPGSQSSDFFELLNPQDEQNGHEKKDDILPSYDFQPIRPMVTSSLDVASVGGSRVWNSADSKSNPSTIRNYGSLEPHDLAIAPEKDKDVHDMAIISEIERTMKKYTDNLLHSLEGVSARLSQMETRTRHLESSFDDLKVWVGNIHGSTDGKLRQMENILREVQAGIQMLRDKQEIAEAQLQLSKLQVLKPPDQAVEIPNTTQTDSVPQQSIQPPAVVFQQPASLPTLTPPNAPPQPLQQNPPQAVQLPNQLPTNQLPSSSVLPQDSYYAAPAQPPESTHLQYQVPTQQAQQASPQPYQGPPPHAQYSQPLQLTQQQQALRPINVNPPPQQLQPQMNLHPEEIPYMPPGPHTYPPSIRPPVGPPQSQSGSPSSPQLFGPNGPMYEPSGSRSGHYNFSSGYGLPTSGPSLTDPYAFSGSSHYGGSSMKQPPHSSPSAPSGGSGYSRIPTAQLLPHALPTASSVGSNSSAGTGNRVPIDDVVEKVTTMGFSRDQVRATVKKLTENGQSVDLNVVLDKLMNGGEIEPQKGWFGR